MDRWKQIGKKILYPPIWLMLVLAAASAVLLAVVFLYDLGESPLAYAVYVLSFYTLTVVCLSIYTVFPAAFRKVSGAVHSNQFGHRYLTDAAFKTHVSLHLSLAVNLLYAGVNALSFFLYRSAWFSVLAVYYVILAVMRFLLLRYVSKKQIGSDLTGEWKRSRLCAMILMTLNLVLSGAVLMILYQDKGYHYHGFLIYVVAMYTFYMTVHAILNVIKYRKYNSPVMTTAKVISLSSALVSMLALETAMFSAFGGDMAMADQRTMIAATGAGVSAVVVSMSLWLIIRATRNTKN